MTLVNRRDERRAVLRAHVVTLHKALVEARDGREYDTKRLRDAVAALAVAARQHDLPPERLLIVLKRVVGDRALPHLSQWWRSVLTDRMVRWGIEAYYAV